MSSKPEKQPSRLAKKPDVTELQYLINSQACEPVVLDVLREMKKHHDRDPHWDNEPINEKVFQIYDRATDVNCGHSEEIKEEATHLAAMCIRLIREL